MPSKIIAIFFAALMFICNVEAKQKRHSTKIQKSDIGKFTPVPVQASVVIDAKTGRILHADKEREKIRPASTVKMMTVYLALDALNSGRFKKDTMLTVSKRAEVVAPGKLWLKAGEKISFEDAVKATYIRSCNLSSIVLAEAIAGSEDNFAKMMTKKAKSLGMHDTNFENSHGLPNSRQYSTAVDLAKLGLALQIHHSKYAGLFKQTSFPFRDKIVKGHDKVLDTYPHAIAGKTGFTCASAFNLVTVVKHKGKHLVATVTGGQTPHKRNNKMVALLDRHLGVPPKEKTLKKTTFAAAKSAKKRGRRA